MKHFALLIAAALLVLAPQILRAHDYKDNTVRFTIPDDFSCKSKRDSNICGFTAEKGGLRVTLFNIPSKNVGKRENLRQDNSEWFHSLKGRTKIAEKRPLWKRYDLVTDYRNKDGKGYVRVYRFISAKSICFLVAESPSDSWDEADAIVQSRRWQKSVAFYWDNAGNWFVGFVIWCSIIVCTGIIVFNTIRKFRRKGYLCYGILLVAVICGLSYIGWLMPGEEWLIIGFYALTLYAGIYGMNDNGPVPDSNDNDADGPNFSDGTGTTIHYDI